MRPADFLRWAKLSYSDLQQLVLKHPRIRGREKPPTLETVRRHFLELDDPLYRLPRPDFMRAYFEISGGALTPNDFHGIGVPGVTPEGSGNPAAALNGGVVPIAKKRKPSSIASRIARGKAAARTRARQRKAAA